MRKAGLVVAAILASSCSSSSSTPPPAPKDPTELQTVPDLNPDPNVLEVNLEAGEGTKVYGSSPPTKVWSYNGTIPGPLLDAKVGDRVIVHFTNKLPEPTTIHWHGVRLPAAMDGSLAMQQPIPPGGTFTYAFTLKDEGLFWFHPHMRSDVQIHKGLYGVLRVRGGLEPVVDRERVLALDDIKLDPDGQIPEYLDDMSRMMGREGNTLLVNGTADARVDVGPGELVRFRLVNTANGRFFNLRVPGHTWRVIGTDGGLIPKPYDTEQLLLAPGERYDALLAIAGDPGSEIPILNDPYERGHDSGTRPTTELARLRVSTAPKPAPKAMPTSIPVDLPRLAGTGNVDFPIVLDEAVDAQGEFVFTINGKTFPDVPPFMAMNGDMKVLEVKNQSDMAHPFHLHGFFFQILSKDGVAPPPDALMNKDTLVIPGKTTFQLVARFDEPGMWMYHCHILEHAENGMMGEIHVQ